MASALVQQFLSTLGYWSVFNGTDASKPNANIPVGSLYIATDTAKIYKAVTATSWAELVDATELTTTLASYALASSVPSIPALNQQALIDYWPWGGSPALFAPSTMGNLAYLFPFALQAPITINTVKVMSGGTGGNLDFAIFDSSGTRQWHSGSQATALGWMTVAANLPVTLASGTYYWAVTNAGNNSGAGIIYGTPTVGGGNQMPRWGTVPATSGTMPGSITPGSITKADVNQVAYAILSNFT